jgi:integrase
MPKLVYQPKNSPYFAYDFVVAGVRFHGSTKSTRRSEARKIADGIRARAIADGRRTRKHMTLREATARYWDEHGQRARSADDFVWPKLCLLVDGLGADTRLDHITNDAIAKYIAERRRKPGRAGALKSSTINGDLNILRAVLHRARDHWDIDIGRRRYLSADEQDRLLGNLPPDLANMVVFSLITGVRLASAIGLRWTDVHHDHAT